MSSFNDIGGEDGGDICNIRRGGQGYTTIKYLAGINGEERGGDNSEGDDDGGKGDGGRGYEDTATAATAATMTPNGNKDNEVGICRHQQDVWTLFTGARVPGNATGS